MPLRDRLLALAVAAVWGVNFLAIHDSLEQFPPFLCAAVRWTLIAVPTVLFVPRPKVPLRWLIGYGVGFGILQFAFLYWGMAAGMPTGLASLVLQSSAPFTVVLGATLLGERLHRGQTIGVVVAVAGLAIVGSQRMGGSGLWPFVLVVLGGLGWAFGNLASRQARAPRPLHLTLWMSVVPPVPMFALSLITEGPHRIGHAFTPGPHTTIALLGLLYTCVIGTAIGSGIWTSLMSRHPAGVVAPYSMLVPVVGLSTAWLALGERPGAVEVLGAAVVIGGVLYGSRNQPRVAAAIATAPSQIATPIAASTITPRGRDANQRQPVTNSGSQST
jgi:O-acetylserine/cysteine efflux transporter